MAKEKTPEQLQKQAERQAKKEARKAEKLAKEEAYYNASPAESAKANNQKVDNNAIDNEPVTGTTWDVDYVDNPIAKYNHLTKDLNGISVGKKVYQKAKEGDYVGAVLEATGLPSVGRAIKQAPEVARYGAPVNTGESKIYGTKLQEEKAKMEEEKTPEAEVAPKIENRPLESNGKSMLDGEPKTEPASEFQKLSDDIHNNYGSIYNDDVQKLPTFMTSAYKNGAFGVPGSTEAKTRMGYFIANHLGTTLANTLGGIGNAAMANAGKAGTYQAENSAWDEMQKTNLQKGMETSWNREQAKLDTDVQSLKELIGKDVNLINDRKEQEYLIKMGEKMGQKYESLGEKEKAQVISGMLLKQYQRTGDTKALAGASALVELTKTGGADMLENGITKVRNWLGI